MIQFKSVKGKILSFLILLFFSLTPFFWFKNAGFIIDGVDTNFPLDPLVWFKQRLFVWNVSQNAGADASSAVSGLVFHGLQAILYKFGFSLTNTEKLTFVFWFFALCFSIYYLISVIQRIYFSSLKEWWKIYLPRILGLTFYVFNLYEFDVWKNVKVANLMLSIALPFILATLFLLIYRKISKSQAALQTLVASFILSGMGLNPPYFMVLVGAVVFIGILSLFDHITIGLKDYKHKIFSTVLILAIIFISSSYWLVPLSLNLLGVTGERVTSIKELGAQDLLGGLSKNTSILAVMRLQGAWDWYENGLYGIPYVNFANLYFNNYFLILFSIIIPTTALIGFFLGRKRFYTLYFIFLSLLGIFLSAGTHPPFGFIYLWIYSKLPFASFFRSPWYIFTPFIVLGYSVLIFAFATELLQSLRYKKTILTFLIALLLGNFLYSAPLIKGQIFKPNDISYFYLKIPDYVFSFKNYLKNIPDNQRILNLPFSSSESFSWGYSGVTPLVSLFSDKGVIHPIYGLQTQNFITNIGNKIFSDIQNSGEAIKPFGVLNIGYFLNKRDISFGENFNNNFSALSIFDIKNRRSFGPWNFYPLKKEYTLPLFWVPYEEAKVIGDPVSLVPISSLKDYNSLTQLDFVNPDSLSSADFKGSAFYIYPECVGCSEKIEFYPDINNQPVLPGSIFYKIISFNEEKKRKATLDPLQRADLDLNFATNRVSEVKGLLEANGQTRDLIIQTTDNFQNSITEAISDLNDADQKREDTNGEWIKLFNYLSYYNNYFKILSTKSEISSLNLGNKIDDLILNLEKEKFAIKDKFWLTTTNSEKKYAMKIPTNGIYQLLIRDDKNLSAFFENDPILSSQISIDGNISTESGTLRNDGWVNFGNIYLSQGNHRVDVLLPKAVNIADQGNVSLVSDKFLETEEIDFKEIKEGYNYRISFDYRTLQGYPPRFILSEKTNPGENNITILKENLAADQNWQSYDHLFRKGDSKDMHLTFISLPDLKNTSIDEIRNLRMEVNLNPEILFKKEGLNKKTNNPAVSFVSENPTEYLINVVGAKDPFNIIFSMSFAKGWQASIEDRKIDEGNHFLANGYANGWKIDKKGNYQIRIKYWPQDVFVGGLTMIALLFIIISGRFLFKNYGN